jgi:hypothetical protein
MGAPEVSVGAALPPPPTLGEGRHRARLCRAGLLGKNYFSPFVGGTRRSSKRRARFMR